MQGWITSSQLYTIINIMDNLCGTIEPSHRKAYFYFDRGMKAFVSDGCSKLLLNFSRDFLPFDGVFILPIQYLKGLLRGCSLKEDKLVDIIIEDGFISFNFEEMSLKAPVQKSSYPPAIDTKFDVISQSSIKKFIYSCDFASAAFMEGDMITVESTGKYIYFYGCGGFFQLIAKYTQSSFDFRRAIEYTTMRHVVKALQFFRKDSVLSIGINEHSLLIYVPGSVISICTDTPDALNTIGLEKNFEEVIELDSSFLKKALDKLYISFSKGVKAYFIINSERSLIYTQENDSHISFNLPYKSRNSYLIGFNSRKMRSILSRMPLSLILGLTKKEAVIKDKEEVLIAKFPVQEYKLTLK